MKNNTPAPTPKVVTLPILKQYYFNRCWSQKNTQLADLHMIFCTQTICVSFLLTVPTTFHIEQNYQPSTHLYQVLFDKCDVT